MISFPPFQLDSDNKCLWKSTATGAMHRLTLAPRAFDMLEFLIRNAGRLVTHEGLLTALWPNQWVQPEVIKTHVRSIRSVLEDDARQPRFIETHRSRGYRFIADIVSSGPDRLVAPAPADIVVMSTSGAHVPGRLTLQEIAALLEQIPDEPSAAWAREHTHRADSLTVDSLTLCAHGFQAARLTVVVSYLRDDADMVVRPASVLH
ncbi:winged helix-turn-helix domain-containing protein [Paraburkholderia kururiensis]|uniref:Helix-turn-helix domain-containing protein n=1 Tax=Paraburkholderia kururiensis TaxID=984307 RepID=A0ABZ0WQA6_9BURK|nr:helix-turn-helix domain-containing protein [Paraburkholderia kururiensis]WQD79458.1 helix-turn-helix domain-containing protein [Paraburkholderia kururiensis]